MSSPIVQRKKSLRHAECQIEQTYHPNKSCSIEISGKQCAPCAAADIQQMERRTKMAEILLCKHPYSLDSLDHIHNMYSLRLKHKPRTGPPVLIPYQPYLHSTRPSITDESILATLDHHLPKKNITDMAFEFGEDNAVAITEIAAALRAYGAGATGAATSIYSKRIQDFGAAVKRYQDALLEYRNIVTACLRGPRQGTSREPQRRCPPGGRRRPGSRGPPGR